MTQTLSDFLSPSSFAWPSQPLGPWTEHAPFAAWLLDRVRPDTVAAPAPGEGGGIAAWLGQQALASGLDLELLGVGAAADAAWLPTVAGLARALPDGRVASLPGSGLLLLDAAGALDEWCLHLPSGWIALLAGAAAADWTPTPGGFRFRHGGGLVVCAPRGGCPLVDDLASLDPSLAARIRFAYARLGGAVAAGQALQAARAALRAGTARPGAGATMPGSAGSDTAALSRAQARAASLAGQVASLGAQLHALQQHIQVVESSTSWRLTAPLRRILHRVPTARRRLRGLARLGWWTVTLQLPRRLSERRHPLLVGSDLPAQLDWPPDLPPALPPVPVARGAMVSVVVCVHDALDDARRCLDSVLAHSRAPYELVVVDDGSGPDTRAMLDAHPGVQANRLLRHEPAQGYTRAANAGLRAATGAMVVLLNSDTIVTPGWLEALERVLDRDTRCAAAGPLSNTASWQSVPLLSENGDWAANPLPDGFGAGDMARMLAQRPPLHPALGFLNGFCLALRRAALDEIGLFDEASFPQGYGEENDWCIRARQAGWRLRLADDGFVLHMQSRSFSHARRLVLAEAAGHALAAKHDQARDIDAPAAACRHSLALHGNREWVGQRFERERLIGQGRAWAGARLAVVLPVAAEGGGANVVLQETAALERMGVSVSLVNLSRHEASARAAYPEVQSWRFVESEVEIAGLLAGGFDAAIATAHQSAYWLPGQEEQPGCRMAYYVQDYEPLFYPAASPDHALARLSYLQDPRRLLVTKTGWNRDMLLRETGMRAVVLGPSVDVDRFRPADRAAGSALRVCAMVRPSSERRSPEMTFRLLSGLTRELGRDVECHVFGCDERELAAYRSRHDGAVRNHGRLRRPQVAALLRAMDVFVDLSSYQAMGLTLLEAMASGLVAIGPLEGASGEFVSNGTDGLLVPTMDEAAAAVLLRRLASGDLAADPIRRAAAATAQVLHPERAAVLLLQTLLPQQAGRPVA